MLEFMIASSKLSIELFKSASFDSKRRFMKPSFLRIDREVDG
jgi:hypothetical protein